MSAEDPTVQHFPAFGLQIASQFPLPGLKHPPHSDNPVGIIEASAAEVHAAFSGSGDRSAAAILGEGHRVTFDLGQADDLLVVYAGHAFHVDSAVTRVLCAPHERADWGWQRQLLDTVLHSASFMRGFELLHCSAIATPRGAVAFAGPSGAGKSSLLAEMLLRGHRLLADDILAVQSNDIAVWGLPAPAVMNLPDNAPAPALLGAVPITRFESEHEVWASVPGACTEPSPLVKIFLVDQTQLEPLTEGEASVLDLFPFTVSLPHTRERARRRFELLSDVTRRVGVVRLGRRNRAPGAVADIVDTWLAGQPALSTP